MTNAECICHGPRCSFCEAIESNPHVAAEFTAGSLGHDPVTGESFADVIALTGCTCPRCPACSASPAGIADNCEWSCF